MCLCSPTPPPATYRSQGQVGQALATRNITKLQGKLTTCASFPSSLRFVEFRKSLNLRGLSLVFFLDTLVAETLRLLMKTKPLVVSQGRQGFAGFRGRDLAGKVAWPFVMENSQLGRVAGWLAPLKKKGISCQIWKQKPPGSYWIPPSFFIHNVRGSSPKP